MSSSEPQPVTFEAGYDELTQIARRLQDQSPDKQLSVGETVELFARAKGLELALGSYLSEQEGRIEQIERGEGVPTFKVVAMAEPDSPGSDDSRSLQADA